MEPANSGLPRTSKVLLDQICTVDKQRLGNRISMVGTERIQEVNAAIRLSLEV